MSLAQKPTGHTITPFDFQGNNLRTTMLEGEPWFCLADVCRVLDIKQPTKVSGRLDDKGVATIHAPTSSGVQNMLFVNEPNLYRVIFQSRKAEAEAFQSWVFDEVLPALRKEGQYSTKQLSPLDALEAMVHQLRRQERDIDELKITTNTIEAKLDATPLRSDGKKRAHVQTLIQAYAKALGGSRNDYAFAYASFKQAFNVVAFDDVCVVDYERAVKMLTAWIEEVEPHPRLLS